MNLHLEESVDRHGLHERCWACGNNPYGLNLQFASCEQGVQGQFDCDSRYAGYEGILHGGIVASLLDSAMTNCLFHADVVAVTAELTVRYRHPVLCDQVAQVNAQIRENRGGLWIMRAELWQQGQLKATAIAKFLQPVT